MRNKTDTTQVVVGSRAFGHLRVVPWSSFQTLSFGGAFYLAGSAGLRRSIPKAPEPFRYVSLPVPTAFGVLPATSLIVLSRTLGRRLALGMPDSSLLRSSPKRRRPAAGLTVSPPGLGHVRMATTRHTHALHVAELPVALEFVGCVHQFAKNRG